MTASVPVKGLFFAFLTGNPSGGRDGVKGAVFGVHLDPLPRPDHWPQLSREQSSDVFSELCSLVGTGLALLNDLKPALHLHHFSVATLGSTNHVFGLVMHHDCLYKLSPEGRGGASNQDVGLSLSHWAKRTAPHANRAPLSVRSSARSATSNTTEPPTCVRSPPWLRRDACSVTNEDTAGASQHP